MSEPCICVLCGAPAHRVSISFGGTPTEVTACPCVGPKIVAYAPSTLTWTLPGGARPLTVEDDDGPLPIYNGVARLP